MLNFGLALATLALAVFDVWFSRRRILKYGAAVELNAELKKAAETGKLDLILLIRIVLPTAVLVGVGVAFNLTTALGFYLGFRTALFYFQLLSIKFEAALDTHLSEHK